MLLNLLLLFSCHFDYDEDFNTFDMQLYDIRTFNVGYEKSKKSSVMIEAYNAQNIFSGHGSGNYFYSGPRKFIITANHVVEREGTIFVKEQDGTRHKAEVIYQEASRDVAILYVHGDLKVTTPVHLHYMHPFNNEGKNIYFTSCPDGTPFVLGTGVIVKDDDGFFYSQSLAWPGSSGAIAFDARGNVVGVLTGVRIAYDSVANSGRMLENYVFIGRFEFIDRWKIKRIFQDAGI